MQQQAYQVHDVDELTQRLTDLACFRGVIDNAVDEWRKCLYVCIRVKKTF